MELTSGAIAAEEAVAGTLLIYPELFPKIREICDPGDFRVKDCKAIYGAAWYLHDQGKALDFVTITATAGEMGASLSKERLKALMDAVPTSANAEAWAEEVRKNGSLYAMQTVGMKMVNATGLDNIDDLMAQAVENIGKIRTRTQESKTICLDGITAAFDELTTREKAPESLIPTKYERLDFMLGGGLMKGGLYIIAGRPGMGKSSFALAIADKVGGSNLFVSLEMTPRQLIMKRISRKAKINSGRLLMGGKLTEDEIQRVTEACGYLSENELHINKKVGLTVGDIESLAMSIPDVKVVFIDYLGLIMPSSMSKTQYERITEISGSLKQMALRLNVPVVALCQLNRAPGKDRAPQLCDLRDSGAIEQDADAVILLNRTDYYDKAQRRDWDGVEMTADLAKNRYGITGEIKYDAFLNINEFKEVPKRDG